MAWWGYLLIIIGYLFVGLCMLAVFIRAGVDEYEFEDGMDIAFVILWPLAALIGLLYLFVEYQILIVAAKGILKIVLAIFYTIKAFIFKEKEDNNGL